MDEKRAAAIQYAHENRARFLSELQDFLKIPSVSTDPENTANMKEAAYWLAHKLNSLGLKNVNVFQTPQHPIVFGECLTAGSTKPTILVYGHYDVQPPDPLDLWETPPFVPSIRNNQIFARGVSDMKGQITVILNAVESILQQGPFPINLKFLIEGEEEIGSPSIRDFIKKNKKLLSGDVALNLDSGMIAPGVPTITYSLRGLAYFEIRVQGPKSDLHSGVFGGVINNPANVLCQLIAGLQDKQGRITLPGFYNRVRPLDNTERDEIANLPITDTYFLEKTGVRKLWGEDGYTPAERVGARPTLDVNGIYLGYIGTGSKTIIPSNAMAKLSMRIVPDQNPDEIHQQLLQYMRENAPQTVTWEVIDLGGGPACITDRDTQYIRAFYQALKTTWNTAPTYKREGGSIPIVADMKELLDINSVISGFGLPDDNIHAPNEKLNLTNLYNGIDAIINFFYNLES